MNERSSLQIAGSTDPWVVFNTQDQVTVDLHAGSRSMAAADVSQVVVDAEPSAAPPESNGSAPTGLFGCYELLDKLGSGGSGSVYKARHTKLDRFVALKVLSPRLLSDRRAIQRFELELKAIGKLEHPHIVRALDAGDIDGMHYLVMEYVDGQDLSWLVQRQGRLSVRQACRLIRQAALGLAYAHSRGLVHRDIKPANLLLSRQRTVKILDLGLAKFRQSEDFVPQTHNKPEQLLGTPDYMAPERWSDEVGADHRADLYALGCTLHFVLTGAPPFKDVWHPTVGEKMEAHLGKQPPSLQAQRTDIPDRLESTYQWLLAKNPAQRPPSGKTVAKELEAVLQATPSLGAAGASR